MKTKISKQVTYWLGVVAIGLMVGLSIQFVAAWTEPTAAPPGGNVGAPVNTSAIGQSKAGNLSVNSTFYVPLGNSGFGTLSPAYRVDILGSMRLQPTAAPAGSNGAMYYDQGTNKFKCYQNGAWVDCVGSGGYWAANGNHIYNTNTANVGIGTTNPGYKLHIMGEANIDNGAGDVDYRIKGKRSLGYYGGWSTTTLYINGYSDWTSGTQIKGAGLTVDGTGYFGGILTANQGPGTAFLVPSGNSGFGTLSPSYRVDILGSMRLQPTVAPAANNGAMYYDSGLGKFRCYENGVWVNCVGINTSGITTCTDATLNKIYWNGSQLTCGTDQTGGGGGLSGSGTLNYVAKWTAPTTLGNSIIYDNGNVGIGTTDPKWKLDVNGDIMSSGSNTWGFHTPDDGRTSLYFGRGSNGNIAEWPIEFKTGGGAYFAGNVGIGTGNPGAKLHVMGDIKAQGKIHPKGEGVGEYIANGVDDGIGDWGLSFRAGSQNRMYIQNGGNVGIGTTGPGQKLDVQGGNIKTSGQLFTNNFGSLPNGWGGIHTWDIHARASIRTAMLCLGGGWDSDNIGDCRTVWPSGGVADNLGNHTATQALNMNGNQITGGVSGYTPALNAGNLIYFKWSSPRPQIKIDTSPMYLQRSPDAGGNIQCPAGQAVQIIGADGNPTCVAAGRFMSKYVEAKQTNGGPNPLVVDTGIAEKNGFCYLSHSHSGQCTMHECTVYISGGNWVVKSGWGGSCTNWAQFQPTCGVLCVN